MAGAATWPLVGRDEELDLLADAWGDGPRSSVIAGPAGVGKSRLAAALLDRAASDGVATRRVRATRSTATIPFGAFAPWVPADDTVAAGDRLQTLRAVAADLVGGHERVVVAVDDAHLLDDGSAALVLHLAADPRVSIVATVRSGEPCPDAVTALWKENLAERVDLQPLSEDETAALLAAGLGGAVDPSARDRVWSLTRGLPLYLREVVRAALDQGVLVADDDRWSWRGALAGSDRLLELIGDRLAHAGEDERRLVELVALGEPLPLAIIAELGLRAEVAAVEQLGLVEVDDATTTGADDGEPRARLAHPLYTEVVRAQVPPARARDRRSALVTAALAVGWQRRDPILVAEWAIESDVRLPAPDAVAAARRALALAEWALAERLSVVAAEDGSGGPDAVLTRAIALAPQVRWDQPMVELAERALEGLDDQVSPQVVGEAARIHAWLLFFVPDRVLTLDDIVAATERLPATIRPTAYVHTAFQAVLSGRPADAVVLAEAAARARTSSLPSSGEGGIDGVTVQVQSVTAFARGFQGRPAEALVDAEAGLPHVAAILTADPVPGNPAGAMPVAFCLALVLDGRIGEASAIASMLHGGLADGARPLLALAGALAARMELFAGRLDASRRLADEALAICRETGQLPASHWPASILASAGAQAGEVVTGERVLAEAAASAPAPALYAFENRLARGWLLAAGGLTTDAQSEARQTADLAAEGGMHAYSVFALLDLARFGAAPDAAERLASLPADVAGSFVETALAHARGLAGGDADALTDVSNRFEAMGALLLAAEASAAAAGAFASTGRHGSEVVALGRARVLAASCSNPATPALRNLDGDALLSSLTAREREVVELAARGLTNREIAEQLFVSVRTVNTHLYRSYAKLGVNDRAQLAAWVLADP